MRATEFDLASVVIVADERSREERYRSYAMIGGQPRCLAATLFGGAVRVIGRRGVDSKEYR